MPNMLRSRSTFSIVLIALVLGINAGCIFDGEDNNWPQFTYYVSLDNTNGNGYLLMPFPYNVNDLNSSTDLSYIEDQNISSYSIESTIHGTALNISFIGDFSFFYRERISPNDYRITEKNPMSPHLEWNSTQNQYYAWIYFHGVSNNTWFYWGYYTLILGGFNQYDYGDEFGYSLPLLIEPGWQLVKLEDFYHQE